MVLYPFNCAQISSNSFENKITNKLFTTKSYICVCVCFCVCVCVCINFIKHNRHFMSTYFLLDPFVLLYCFYRIRRELIYVLSIVVCIPSTFCQFLSHHQGRIYYKSDVTFVFACYYYVRASLLLKIIAFAFKWFSINSVSS